MIVCQCKGTTDRQVRELVRRGACDLETVGRTCAAGTICGGCVPTLRDIVRPDAVRSAPQRAALLGR